MITFLAILSSIGALSVVTLLIGEFFAERNKESKFSTWWRDNVVGSYEDSDF